MRVASYPCPECKSPMLCPAGPRPVRGRPAWKKRTRECPRCGTKRDYVEGPTSEIMRPETSVLRQVRALVTQADKVAKGLKKIG